MNTFDLSPFFRSTIGFDRLFDQLDYAWRQDTNWPQYDVLKTDDDHYRIMIAVPGYQQADLSLETRNGLLTVKGERNVDPNHNQYLYRGIGGQNFTRTFQVAEYVKVENARLKDGLLCIELKRELPDAMLPKHIEIETGSAISGTEQPARLHSHAA